MAEITQTEVVAGSLRRLKLGGIAFRVPRTPTLKYMFWIRAFNEKFSAGELVDDDIIEAYEQTLEFLHRYNSPIDREKLEANCELTDLIDFYPRCFGVDAEPGEEDESRPPRPTRGGRSSSRTPSKSRS